MVIGTPTPTKAQIEELRRRFVERYEQSPPEIPFHYVDLYHIQNDNGMWCQRFLEMNDLQIPAALDKLWRTCIWRQEFGVNELNETNLNVEYLHDGSVFVRNADVDGKPLLIFRCKYHSKSKNVEDVLRIVIYWVERTQRQNYLTQMTIFFDMSGTGLSNMDVEFVRRIIDTFKMYYPNSLNYILVYEMAWILNAVFKVIKVMLPPRAVQILKLITKKDIHNYVDKSNALVAWGGDDNYEFHFEAEKQKHLQGIDGASVLNRLCCPLDTEPMAIYENTHEMPYVATTLDKKVHFNIDKPPEQNMLRITPIDFITFERGDTTESGFTITSIAKIPVAYKIQTTSPEKFRVRPRCGLLEPNESVHIGILLKAEHTLSSSAKDKFLVMGMPTGTTDCSTIEVTELWKMKAANSMDVEQHRLICQYKGAGVNDMYPEQVNPNITAGVVTQGLITSAESSKLTCAGKKPLSSDNDHNIKLEKRVKCLERALYIILVLLVLVAIGFGYLLHDHMTTENCKNAVKSDSGVVRNSPYSCRK